MSGELSQLRWGDATGTQWVETREAAQHSAAQRAAPITQKYPAQNVDHMLLDKPSSIATTYFSLPRNNLPGKESAEPKNPVHKGRNARTPWGGIWESQNSTLANWQTFKIDFHICFLYPTTDLFLQLLVENSYKS